MFHSTNTVRPSNEEERPLLNSSPTLSTDDHDGPPPPEIPPNPEPPPYQDSFQLIPTTPALSTRYEKSPLNEYPAHYQIRSGLFCTRSAEIPPPPEGWLEFVHPEGQNYFYHTGRRIATEANLRKIEVLQVIIKAAGRIDGLLMSQDMVLPTSTELLLEIGNISPESNICKYYFVDHIRRTTFWLQDHMTDDLDLPPVTSTIHLKHLLQQHYWNHVEFFPMHIALPVSVEEELVAILSHACIDYMTSDLSTAPYNQEQGEAFIKIIQSIPDSRRIDGYRNAVMARLWSEITGNYFVNMHGETTSRLSRNQRLLPPPEARETGGIVLIKRVMLNVPERYYTTLCDLWVDKIAYAAHWRTFMTSTLRDWRQITLWAMMLLVSSFGIFGVSLALKAPTPLLLSIVQSMSLMTVLFCLISVSSSLTLIRTYNGHSEAHASETVDFLEAACHATYFLQPLAIMFALPWASFIYAFTCFTMCILFLSFTIDLFAFRVVIWAAVFVALIAGYLTLMFISHGAASLTAQRLRATLPVAPRMVGRRLRSGVDRVGSLVTRVLRTVRPRPAASANIRTEP